MQEREREREYPARHLWLIFLAVLLHSYQAEHPHVSSGLSIMNGREDMYASVAVLCDKYSTIVEETKPANECDEEEKNPNYDRCRSTFNALVREGKKHIDIQHIFLRYCWFQFILYFTSAILSTSS